MEEFQHRRSVLNKKLKSRMLVLQGRYIRESEQLETRHKRGLPGQPEAAHRLSALGELLVHAYQASSSTQQKGTLLLAADARLSGAKAYALSLLDQMDIVPDELTPLYLEEVFLCRAELGEGDEEAWNELQRSEAGPSVSATTARLDKLISSDRIVEALDLVSSSRIEAFISEGQPGEIAARAHRVLARLALAQLSLSSARYHFTEAIALASQTDITNCRISRNFALSLHREYLEVLSSDKGIESGVVVDSHRDYITILRRLLQSDQSSELRSELATAFGLLSSCLYTFGYSHEAVEARKSQIQVINDSMGDHNPLMAGAREQLARLYMLSGLVKESNEQTRLANEIYADFGERAKATRLRRVLGGRESQSPVLKL